LKYDKNILINEINLNPFRPLCNAFQRCFNQFSVFFKLKNVSHPAIKVDNRI